MFDLLNKITKVVGYLLGIVYALCFLFLLGMMGDYSNHSFKELIVVPFLFSLIIATITLFYPYKEIHDKRKFIYFIAALISSNIFIAFFILLMNFYSATNIGKKLFEMLLFPSFIVVFIFIHAFLIFKRRK